MSEPTQFTWSHLLYRLYAADGGLLYVGRTAHFPTRMYSHAGVQPWWSEVARAVVETFPDFETLDLAERAAIRDEGPLYNRIRYSPPVPRREDESKGRRPRARQVRPAEMPTDDPVLVRPVDRICVSAGGPSSCFANAVLIMMRCCCEEDVYETNRVSIDVEKLANWCKARVPRVADALHHLARAGWLIDHGSGVFDCTIPRAVYELGPAACRDGERCGIHGGERGELGPVAPLAVG